ncbi:MAG: hypothetical protein ACK55I_07435, partial [bacterium]
VQAIGVHDELEGPVEHRCGEVDVHGLVEVVLRGRAGQGHAVGELDGRDPGARARGRGGDGGETKAGPRGAHRGVDDVETRTRVDRPELHAADAEATCRRRLGDLHPRLG